MTLGILPVSGLGTRLKELGKHYPKCLLPFNDKPLIYAQLDYFRKQDISQVCIVLNHNKEQIVKTVKRYPSIDKLKITYVEQPVLNGLAYAVKLAQDAVSSDSSQVTVTDVLIVLGDIIPSSRKLLKNTLGVQTVQDYSRWCMVKDNNGQVKYFDKPTKDPGTTLALCGVYYVPLIDFSKLDSSVETECTDSSERTVETELSVFLPDDAHLENIYVKDFGTLNDFLVNKGTRNSREFNDVCVDQFIVKKTSKDAMKIANEINWFRKRPDHLRIYSANVLYDDISKASYTTERVLAPTLRELYLYLDRTSETWTQITRAVQELINKESFKSVDVHDNNVQVNNVDFDHDEIFNKTVKRVHQVLSIDVPFCTKTIDEFLKEFKRVLQDVEPWFGHVHGDLCFSNMFWSDGLLKLIDPRGSTTGSMYYELAKFIHSLDYDFIDAELYSEDKIYDAGTSQVRLVVELLLSNLGLSEKEIYLVKMIEASLFLSMIPLHSHCTTNQAHFMRLFEEKYKSVRGW